MKRVFIMFFMAMMSCIMMSLFYGCSKESKENIMPGSRWVSKDTYTIDGYDGSMMKQSGEKGRVYYRVLE